MLRQADKIANFQQVCRFSRTHITSTYNKKVFFLISLHSNLVPFLFHLQLFVSPAPDVSPILRDSSHCPRSKIHYTMHKIEFLNILTNNDPWGGGGVLRHEVLNGYNTKRPSVPHVFTLNGLSVFSLNLSLIFPGGINTCKNSTKSEYGFGKHL